MSSILVVEDEESISGLLNDALGNEEYQTVRVLNGDDAVQFALREIPRLIVFDLTLPHLNGQEMIRKVRDHPKSMHIPILALGDSNTAAYKVSILEAGADHYLFKAGSQLSPDLADELLVCVRSQLRRSQQCSLSPLTLLPGGLQLERAIDCKLSNVNPWSILYLDLDNFKAFNDVYGFLAGNNMILLVSHICQRIVYEDGNADDFLGHVGGDDFVIVTTPERSHMLSRNIMAHYKRESALLYRADDLEQGTISGVDRKGRPYKFPLVSLSIGVVSSYSRRLYSMDEIGTLVADAKRQAKQTPGNVFYLSSQPGFSNQTFSRLSYAPPQPRGKQFDQNIFHFVKEDALAEFK